MGRDAQLHGKDNFRAVKSFQPLVWKLLWTITLVLACCIWLSWDPISDINIWERSSLYESMINGRHDELNFVFLVESEVFNKLFYLVDGIYPQLTRFLSSESDPHTKLAYSFIQDQESHRKDIEQGFGALKLKFSP